ncbi:MAG: mechanosensitive ion channel family protein [Rhodobacteraceae bacterium]|nr:mechanosensitive ion channel family protein [Paracoccaceae bacterium]
MNIVVSFENFALLQRNPHYITLFLLVMAPALDTAVRGIVRHVVPPMQGEGRFAEQAYYATKRSYIRIGRVLVTVGVLVLIASAWQINLTNLAAAGVGARIAAGLVEFLIAVAFGYLVWEVVSLWINRKLAAEMTASGYDPENEAMGGGDGGGAGGSRLSTVLPLVLLTARIAIVVIFGLLALGNLGIDTTPLLAGAGIAGLAIGFGAQKLVTDVVSGVFFLVDDAFRTGEYVEVDGTMGTVEKISVRSMQLRHHKGPVHTIPYGEIPKLTNYSRDWVIMKLKFTVPFDTDPNKVKKIFKKIGQDMLQEPAFEGDFLQPFKSQGVLEIYDVGMVIRGKFMAKPGSQFMIRKEIFNRVSAAFAENGIDFARREVRVAIPGMEHKEGLSQEDKASIAAAASQAAQEMRAAADTGKDDR